jgi:hypothetical protein
MARAALIHCFDALVAPSSAVTLKPATLDGSAMTS